MQRLGSILWRCGDCGGCCDVKIINCGSFVLEIGNIHSQHSCTNINGVSIWQSNC